MIRIKDLTIKNFMSTGAVTQAIDFSKDQLTLVLGENLDQGGEDSGSRNGTGKSSIINALSYALYGQALTNIKRNNLINKTNGKGMLVTLNFEKGGDQYRIERGRSPNILKFYINNREQVVLEDESQGDSRKTQEDIDKLLGMSHTMFKNIVALNTYTEPFLSMKTNDQREIIEQLLGITLLSEKASILKDQIKTTKDAITEETLKINAIQSSNLKIQESIEQLKKRQRAWLSQHETDCKNLEKSINELKQLDIDQEIADHEVLKNWKETNSKKNNLVKDLNSYELSLLKANATVKKLEKDVEDLDEAKCYACGQSLHENKKQEILEEKANELLDAINYVNEINEKIVTIKEEILKLGNLSNPPNTYYDSEKDAYNHQNNMMHLKKTLDSKIIEIDPYQEQIDSLTETALQEVEWSNVNSLTGFKEHQEFLLKLLTSKDSFIRKKIIDQNLLYLNSRLSVYLEHLGLTHQVVFLNDLSVEIKMLGQDLDFDNLSRGERNRLILGLSFAFRDVWESLYENINILFIDELIDSGMDTAGVENSLAVLKKMSRERSKNIFLISHREELVGRVNNILKVVKENNFTTYETDIEIII
jgi:DNA repair exonuclease SbcCD ATPase subunit